MTTMLMLALAQGWAMEARATPDELRVAGKAAGTSVTLEIRRRIWRFDAGRLEAALEEPEARKVAVSEGAFVHAEPAGRPGRFELRAIAEDGRTLELTVRSPAAAVVAWARAGIQRIDAAASGLREVREASPRTRRRLAAWRASGEASELPAAGAALAALAGDVEQALLAKPDACPFLSSMDGRPFKLDGLPERLALLADLAGRERDLMLLDALEGLAGDAIVLARGGDGRRWNRAEPGLQRTLEHVRHADGGRLGVAVEHAAALLELGAQASECLTACEEELERRWESLEAELGRLLEDLKIMNP
jgi:hypothetical protein